MARWCPLIPLFPVRPKLIKLPLLTRTTFQPTFRMVRSANSPEVRNQRATRPNHQLSERWKSQSHGLSLVLQSVLPSLPGPDQRLQYFRCVLACLHAIWQPNCVVSCSLRYVSAFYSDSSQLLTSAPWYGCDRPGPISCQVINQLSQLQMY